jgi:hypothetical protein
MRGLDPRIHGEVRHGKALPQVHQT